MSSLKLREPVRLISSFNRPNITYKVVYMLEKSPPLAKQLSKLIAGVSKPSGETPCCIVYTLKRETADEYAHKLRMQGRLRLEHSTCCSTIVKCRILTMMSINLGVSSQKAGLPAFVSQKVYKCA